MNALAVPVAVLVAHAVVSLGSPQTFTSRVEAVRVDVLVTENGRPVRGLGAGDFEIRDNGVLQEVDLVSFEQIPLNVVLALDMSNSVTDEGLEHLRLAGQSVLEALKPTDRAGVLTFSHVVVQRSGLTNDLKRLRAALDASEASGNTALIDASQAGMVLADSGTGRSLLVVFSDGLDTSSWLSRDLVLETARRSEVVVYGVAVGSTPDDFLRDLSELTGGRWLRAETTEKVRALFLQVLEEFRYRYVVSYTPRGVQRGGWHKLAVRIKGRDAVVRARPGYQFGS